jgi:hypothetical protein
MEHLEVVVSHFIVRHYLAFQCYCHVEPEPIVITALKGRK